MVHFTGVSRSETRSSALAYLIKYTGMNLRQAFLHTRTIRPNMGFCEQLIKYEKTLHGPWYCQRKNGSRHR